MSNKRFTYNKKIHNLEGPSEIVPYLYELVKPKSVVDVGCGVGAFLYSFKELGVTKILGLDSKDADRTMMSKYLAENEFKEVDLEYPLEQLDRFDLAICLEVAEHLSINAAEAIVDNLVNLSDIILFSASIPYQGGENHQNEQWPVYWQNLFAKRNFIFHDILRDKFWNNEKISYWHRQNIFLITRKDNSAFHLKDHKTNIVLSLVHPVLYLKKAEAIEKITSGEFSIPFYLKLLIKGFLHKAKKIINAS